MELEDKPGQLVKVLDPIAKLGGNIQSVIHLREKKTPLGRLPVTVVFEIQDKEKLERLLQNLRDMGIRITQVGEKELLIKTTLLLLGHIVHSDLQKIIDALNAMESVRVSDLTLAVGGVGMESAARMSLLAGNPEQLVRALSLVEEMASRMGLLVVRCVGQ
jgi:ACT domain-containing protein